MKLKELKELIDSAVIKADDTDAEVEVWCGNCMFEIEKVTQFDIIPDLNILIKEAL